MIRASLLVLTFVAGTGRLDGQTLPPPVSPEAGRMTKRAEALRLDRAAIRLESRLDEDAWRTARWISDFVQKEPNEGAEPTERTEVAFFYDDAALYVGARMYARDPARTQAPRTRRDVGVQAEHFFRAPGRNCLALKASCWIPVT